MAVSVLLLTGPVGVGKSAVLGEIGHLLAERGLPHATVDLDTLSEYFPRPESDPYGTTVALLNLAAVWRNYHAAGAERLVLAQVVESEDDLAGIRHAVPEAKITVCRLRAPVRVLQDRVRRRELGGGLAWHVERAAQLATQFESMSVEHLLVDVENRGVRSIAEEVLHRARWLRT